MPLSRITVTALFWASCAVASSGRISTDHGFVDIDLPITQITEESGFIKITARGDIDGKEVGFEVDFPTGAKQVSATASPVHIGSARVRTIGAASNNFVALLKQKYSLPGSAAPMVNFVDASVAGLDGDPAHVLDKPINMKFFFFDSGPEERYAEVYINVDGKGRELQFHEKDEDYRKPLVLALTKAPNQRLERP